MKSIILVGGFGTRLRPLTCETPKSLVPILGVPFIEHMLRWLIKYQIEEAYLTISHLAPAIQRYIGDGKSLGIKVHYVQEAHPLGTAGAIRNAAQSLSEPFLVLNGDIFTEINLSEMKALHTNKHATATIALTPVTNPSAFGLVKSNVDGSVSGFIEKPLVTNSSDNYINAGIYILEPEVLSLIPNGVNFSVERGVFPELVRLGKPFYAYPSSAYWIDIGTPEKYVQLNRDVLLGLVGSFGFKRGDEKLVSNDVRIHKDNVLKGPLFIDKGCRLDSGNNIDGPTIIGKGCQLEPNVSISQSILWERIRVGAGTRIINSVIASDCLVGERCHLDSVVIGEKVKLPAGSIPEPGERIFSGSPP